jgi:hypothetical protein
MTSLYLIKNYMKMNAQSGFDQRIDFFPNIFNNNIDNVTFEQVLKIQEKSEMIDYLESNNTKTEDKLHEIGGRGVPSVLNVFNGGLLTDWNFEFDMEFDPNALNLDGQ